MLSLQIAYIILNTIWEMHIVIKYLLVQESFTKNLCGSLTDNKEQLATAN